MAFPDQSLAISAAVMFSLLAGGTVFFWIWHRATVWTPWVIGTILQASGYAALAYFYNHPGVEAVAYFFAATNLATLAMLAALASVYLRLLYFRRGLPVKTTVYLILLAELLTVVALGIQLAGIIHLVSGWTSIQTIGDNETRLPLFSIGQVVQLGAIALIWVGIFLHMRIETRLYHREYHNSNVNKSVWLTRWIFVSTVAIAMELIQSITHNDNRHGIDSDWPYWAFGALPMLVTTALFLWDHPSDYVTLRANVPAHVVESNPGDINTARRW